MRRTTASTWIATGCIALGIAAVGAVLTLVSLALLQPPPFPHGERLARVWLAQPDHDPRMDLAIVEANELGARLTMLDGWASASRSRSVATLPGGAERLRGEAVTPRYFELLGVAPQLGRAFAADDFAADAEPAVLLSDAFWRRAYGADPAVVGRTLVADQRAYRIVGVLPAGFAGSIEDDEVEIWTPQAQYQPAMLIGDRSARQTWTLARLPEGMSLDALDGALQAQLDAWRAAHPEHYRDIVLRAEPFGENWRAPLRRNAWLLLAAVAVLLGIAALNVSALLLARALDRRRELALRSALGASRGRLARRLLAETAGIVLAGGALGAALATPLLHGFLALAPDTLPSYLAVGVDPLALGLSAAAIALTALLAGLLPALIGSRAPPAAVLGSARGGTPGRRERRLGDALIAGELALTLVLLVAGSLLLRSYWAMSSTALGYRTDDVLRMAISLGREDAARWPDMRGFEQQLLQRLAEEPGVRNVGLVWPTLPPWNALHQPLQHPRLPGEAGVRTGVHAIDPGLFATLGIPLQRGRGIAAEDWHGDRRVAVISAALAAQLGGADRIVGETVDFGAGVDSDGMIAGRYTVIGVAGDVAWDGLAEQDTGRTIDYLRGDAADAHAYDVYVPLRPTGRSVSIAVQAGTAPLALVEPLKRAIATLAPGSAVHWVSAMDDELAGEYAASRFYTLLVLAFAASALLLAAVGLFATLSQAVVKRQGEIGVRMALGADASRVAREIVGSGLRIAAAGLLLGLVAAWAIARALAAWLYGIGPADPWAFAGAIALLLALVVAASAWPARRAARLDPVEALRDG